MLIYTECILDENAFTVLFQVIQWNYYSTVGLFLLLFLNLQKIFPSIGCLANRSNIFLEFNTFIFPKFSNLKHINYCIKVYSNKNVIEFMKIYSYGLQSTVNLKWHFYLIVDYLLQLNNYLFLLKIRSEFLQWCF